MSEIRTTVTVEITDASGEVISSYSRTHRKRTGDNPRFYASEAEQPIDLARADVLSAVEAVHGKLPDGRRRVG